jgi:hypothetical protein
MIGKRVSSITLVLLSVVVFTLFSVYGSVILIKLEFYFTSSAIEYRTPPVVTFFILMGAFFCAISKSHDSRVVLSLVLFFAFWFGAGTFDIFYRFYNIAFFVAIYLVLEKKGIWFRHLLIKPLHLYSTLMLLWFSINIIILVNGEPEKILNSNVGRFEYTFVPYELNFELK